MTPGGLSVLFIAQGQDPDPPNGETLGYSYSYPIGKKHCRPSFCSYIQAFPFTVWALYSYCMGPPQLPIRHLYGTFFK